MKIFKITKNLFALSLLMVSFLAMSAHASFNFNYSVLDASVGEVKLNNDTLSFAGVSDSMIFQQVGDTTTIQIQKLTWTTGEGAAGQPFYDLTSTIAITGAGTSTETMHRLSLSGGLGAARVLDASGLPTSSYGSQTLGADLQAPVTVKFGAYTLKITPLNNQWTWDPSTQDFRQNLNSSSTSLGKGITTDLVLCAKVELLSVPEPSTVISGFGAAAFMFLCGWNLHRRKQAAN